MIRFDESRHYESPEGFNLKDEVTDGRGLQTNPHMQSSYTANEDVKLYELDTHVSAVLDSRYDRGGENLNTQSASVSITLDTYLDEAHNVQDKEKMKLALQVSEKLATFFRDKGFDARADLLTASVTVSLNQRHNDDPHAGITKIFDQLKGIEQECEADRNPLDVQVSSSKNITKPGWRDRLHDNDSLTIRTFEGAVLKPFGQAPLEDNKARNIRNVHAKGQKIEEIAELAEAMFPAGGEPVTAEQHEQFRQQLEEILTPKRSAGSAKG